jgi:hypothetical protein
MMSTRSDEMTLASSSDPIDLTTWFWSDADFELDSAMIEVLMKAFAQRATKLLREVFEETPPRLSLPILWSPENDGRKGPAVTDPMLLHLDLPLASTLDDSVTYAISLEGCIDDALALLWSAESQIVEEPDGRRICRIMAERLRELAQKLDDACSGGGEAVTRPTVLSGGGLPLA